MPIPRKTPGYTTTRSYQPSKQAWSATYTTGISDRGFRAHGTLREGSRVAREKFDVFIDDFGYFVVSAGGGSRTKVRFRHPMFSPTPD